MATRSDGAHGAAQGARGQPAATYFASAAAFRRWLAANHAWAPELLVGFHKRGTGRPSLTWSESVEEALSFGWIDGVRRSVDAERYTIRFTPRRPGSTWSAVNVSRAKALLAAGRMAPAGKAAFAARAEDRTAIYSYEQRRAAALGPLAERRLRVEPAAWAHWQAQPAWYRRTAAHWVTSAKKAATRAGRLATLVACSARGEAVPPLRFRAGRKASPSPPRRSGPG
jgi:uncharacterized protein YdeI (YjbR/CyaY-like superfamily)